MILVSISDTHGCEIKNIPDGDVFIHCGDYSDYGEYEDTENFLRQISELPHKHKIVIPGNHEVAICPIWANKDFIVGMDDSLKERQEILELIKSYKNVKYLVDDYVVIDGKKFYGTPWCNGKREIMQQWGFYVENYEDRKKLFSKIPKDTDVLITHVPPYGILDDNGYKNPGLGCDALLEVVSEIQPKIHLFGHIHNSSGVVKRGDTLFCNCSILNSSYYKQFMPKILEI